MQFYEWDSLGTTFSVGEVVSHRISCTVSPQADLVDPNAVKLTRFTHGMGLVAQILPGWNESDEAITYDWKFDEHWVHPQVVQSLQSSHTNGICDVKTSWEFRKLRNGSFCLLESWVGIDHLEQIWVFSFRGCRLLSRRLSNSIVPKWVKMGQILETVKYAMELFCDPTCRVNYPPGN